MSITIEMSDQEIAALKQLIQVDSDAEAVAQAARQFLRLSRLRELKAASGKVDFAIDWQAWEALELKDTPVPQ